MHVSVVYGVTGDDIELARSWIEDLTKLPAEARENDNWGSEFYSFGEDIYLHPNMVYPEHEPFDADFPDVPLLVTSDDDVPSKLCALFDSQPARFTKLKEDRRDIVDGDWAWVSGWVRPRGDIRSRAMLVTAIYGVNHDDIEVVREWIEGLTNLQAEARENDNWGSEYYGFGETIRLHTNIVYPEHEPCDQDFPEIPILVDVSEDAPAELCKLFDSQPARFVKLRESKIELIEGEWELVSRWVRSRESH